ncbi:monocarboxylate transporter 7-like [Myripristis murdjan]|uniref:Monocarboxylate transporter 7 n=1 Tax=Myripristis murdjan TaxID=586833 RepID=A0A668AG46_9TELE|nr:monocarboxylate transporter 7-like [Myripristis murdjan]XP_029933461.1 monocarboxylate transporter 7-like [Myripristis murdjan]
MAVCASRPGSILGPKVYPEAPDGGWGWLVAVAFFLVEVFTYGTIKSFGIFLQDLMEEFGETSSRVSWIVSICVFIMTFTAPLSSVMTNRFGFQPVVMFGGLLISTGTITTAFTNSINQMYITTGIVAGLGYCLTFLPTVTILSHYFNRRRPLVTAVASTGESFSMFALAPTFAALRDHIGWRHTMVVIGALQGTIVICGTLLRPIIIKPRTGHDTETDGSSSKELEALSVQETLEGTNSEDTITKENLYTQKIYSQDNELTTDSLTSGDSGVQSLKDTDESSQEKKTSLYKEERLETVQNILKDSGTHRKEPEKEEKKYRDAEKGMRKEDKKDGDEILSTNKQKLLDFSILREDSFICYSLFGLFATLGFFAPQLYVIELSVNRGVERDRATYMLSTMAVAEILGRFSIGWVMTRRQLSKRKLQVLLVCVILMTLVLVAFTIVWEFYGLAVCCALYGFFMGTIASTHIPLLAEEDVVSIKRMSSAAGVYVFIHSFAGLAGPPLGGVLVDVTQNYGSAFYSCAVGMALGGLFLGLVKPAKKGLPCRRRGPNCPEASHAGKGNSVEHIGGHEDDKRRDSTPDCLEIDIKTDHNQTVTTGKGLQVTSSTCENVA